MAPSRREGANIIYPFTPATIGTASEEYLAGLKDCLFVIYGEVTAEPGGLTPPANREYYVVLQEVKVANTENKYTFYAVTPLTCHKRSFVVPYQEGTLRVTSDESDDCVLVLDTDQIYRGGFTPPAPAMEHTLAFTPEVEPARAVWNSLEELRSVMFVNEYRHHDPLQRGNLPADSHVHTFDSDGDVIRLVNGHNCRLRYSEALNTLYIDGGPGYGTGLPDNIPWDSDPPAVTEFLRVKAEGSAEGYLKEYEFIANQATTLIARINTHTVPDQVIIRIDGVPVVDTGLVATGGWLRYDKPVAEGEHTLELEVLPTAGAYWQVQLFVGEPGIKTVNGLNENGNVDIETGAGMRLGYGNNQVIVTARNDPEKE